MGIGENTGCNVGENTGSSGKIRRVEPSDGFQLPTGYYVPAKMDPVICYPRPNGETQSYARYKWAHPDMEYTICVAVQGGAWPFQYTLTGAPAGMTIGQTYGTTANPNADYGVIRWPAEAIPSSGSFTFTIHVLDQSGNEVWHDITITVDTSKFVFLQKGGPDGTGTFNDPVDDIPDILSGHAGKIAVFKTPLSGTYQMPARPDPETTDTTIAPTTAPFSWVAEKYDESPTITFTNKTTLHPNWQSDFYFHGLTTVGGPDYYRTPSGRGVAADIIRSPGYRWNIHRCTFTDMQPTNFSGDTGDGNHSTIFIGVNRNSDWLYCSYVRNTLDNVDRLYAAHIIYSHRYFVAELNVIKNSTNNVADRPQGFLFTKGGNKYVSIRANDCWTNNATDLLNLSVGSDGYSEPWTGLAVPEHEEACWNLLRTSLNTNTICTHCAAHNNGSHDYFLYRNTVLGGQFNVHRWVSPTNATQVLNNVALTTASGITVWTGSATEADNIEGSNSGQTTVNETNGRLVADTYRGLRGHEVYSPVS